MIEEKDRLLLSHLQKGLPLVSQPFAALGAKTGLGAADVLLRIEKLRKEGLLSGIRAFWNHRTFGYQSTWVAMRFGKEELDAKAGIIGSHPGVIYSAERDHDLNFWFFITVPAEHDIEAHVRVLEKQTVPEIAVFLPLRGVLKGAGLLHELDPGTYDATVECFERRRGAEKNGLSLDEIRILRVLQGDLPITDEPFRKIAEAAAVPVGQILDLLSGLIRKGFLRRIGVESAPRAAVGGQKTLVVWQVPEEKLEKVAVFFAEVPEVIHADLRPAYPGFPFPVHTLIRAEDPAELEVFIRRIEDGIGKWPNKTINLVREIKRTPMKYFPKDLGAWWVKNRSLADTAFDRIRA